MGPAGKVLTYDRTVESGAPLAVWSWRDAPVSTTLAAEFRTVDLPLKEMPTVAELDEQIARCTDRVLRERLGRRRAIRTVVGEGRSSPVPLWIWRVGDALLIGQPNEAYSMLQQRLRQTFAPRAVAVMNLVN